MEQIKFSKILHLAADKYLSVDGRERGNKLKYSCDAVLYAADHIYGIDSDAWEKTHTGLREMGLDTYSIDVFKEIPSGPERQAARYNWLKFAAMIAEEQGV